jgi:hypothetical protein
MYAAAAREGVRHHALILLGYSCWQHSYPYAYPHPAEFPLSILMQAKALIALLIAGAAKV